MRVIRKGDDPATIAMVIVAMVVLASTLILLIAVPKPSTYGLQRKYRNRAFELSLLNKRAEGNLAQKQKTVISQTWSIPEQKVGPTALANVTALVKKNGLHMVSFRPQRRNDEASFVQLPYLLTIDGPYPSVMALCRQLEDPSAKLAVSLVQIASAEETSDRVTASIGLVAYLSPGKEGTTKNG